MRGRSALALCERVWTLISALAQAMPKPTTGKRLILLIWITWPLVTVTITIMQASRNSHWHSLRDQFATGFASLSASGPAILSSFLRPGKSPIQIRAMRMLPAPPMMVAGIMPNQEAVTPDSNSPS
jgi:hypothetical protein